jgi:UDP-N-acetylglucosamine 2-epimerase (non-hydrolysing)
MEVPFARNQDPPADPMKLLHVVGARPNFPKLAPVYRAAKAAGMTQVIVHTGQHYDDALSASFFRDLGIAKPDVNLDVGSLSHAAQTARIMERIEPVLIRELPDWVIVYGDVNSTAAAALVASKLDLRVAHVEAGLRSYDRSMPEEVNRIVTDRLADLLLTPSRDAVDTLRREGEPDTEIEFVGNVMIDSLFFALEAARRTGFRASLGLKAGDAIVVTLHRPSNVDDEARLGAIAAALRAIAEQRPVVFTVHPRTAQRLAASAISLGKVQVLAPVPYLEMIDLVADARAVVTDSGGLQEETTALGVPCITVRENTERPITITEGTNRLVYDPAQLAAAALGTFRIASDRRPDGWDGKAGERIVHVLIARGRRTSAPGIASLIAAS